MSRLAWSAHGPVIAYWNVVWSSWIACRRCTYRAPRIRAGIMMAGRTSEVTTVRRDRSTIRISCTNSSLNEDQFMPDLARKVERCLPGNADPSLREDPRAYRRRGYGRGG